MRRKKGDSEALRNRAYELCMSYSEIAEMIGVGKDTIGDWSKRYSWKETKAANSLTKEKIIAGILVETYNLNQAIMERPKGQQFATAEEAQRRLMNAQTIERLSNKTSLPAYFNVLTEFMKKLHHVKPDLAKQMADIAKEFLIEKTKELEK
jgi:uncharacterized protein YjcR